MDKMFTRYGTFRWWKAINITSGQVGKYKYQVHSWPERSEIQNRGKRQTSTEDGEKQNTLETKTYPP